MPERLKKVAVIKAGGSSLIDKNGIVDVTFNEIFHPQLFRHLLANYDKIITVFGGGVRAKEAQEGLSTDYDKNVAGMKITHEHARRGVALLSERNYSVEPQVPEDHESMCRLINDSQYKILCLGGTEPSQSTDAVAIKAAQFSESEGATCNIAIISNVSYIYTENPNDPKDNPKALPIQFSSVPTLVKEEVLCSDPEKFTPKQAVSIDSVGVNVALSLQRTIIFFGNANRANDMGKFFYNIHSPKNEKPITGTILRVDQEQTIYWNPWEVAKNNRPFH